MQALLAERAAELLQLKFPTLELTVEGDTLAIAALSEEAALIVLTHLADNALQHGAKRLTLVAQATTGGLRLWVADDGAGVSLGNRDRIFEPFFTTRREQGGTGMGLEIVRSMLQAHGGTIGLADSPAGAAFEISVPLLKQ